MLKPLSAAQRKFIDTYLFEDPANPKLAELRDAYGLAEVIAGSDDEIDQLLHLAEWAYDGIRVFGKPTVQTENALEIRRCAARYHTFYCAHFAITMSAAATALGWQARPVSVRRADETYRGSNHNVTEVWSRTLGKWVMFDPTYKYVPVGPDGVPLSVWEFGREGHRDGGRGVTWLVGSARVPYTVDHLPIIFYHSDGYGDVAMRPNIFDGYACLAHVPTNCLLGRWPDRSIEQWDQWPDLQVLYPHKDGWAGDPRELGPYYDVAALEEE